MAGGWIYIVTDKPYGTLYVGVTSDIRRRAWEHRDGVADGFTKRYDLKRLVYVEAHDDIRLAIEREKRVKRWQRAWKIELIQSINPDWADLYDTLA
ncbi:MAG: GIY-YIG nuclease family protein [Ferrovibrio sp.]